MQRAISCAGRLPASIAQLISTAANSAATTSTLVAWDVTHKPSGNVKIYTSGVSEWITRKIYEQCGQSKEAFIRYGASMPEMANNRSFLGWLFELQWELIVSDPDIRCIEMEQIDTSATCGDYRKRWTIVEHCVAFHYPVGGAIVE